MKVKIIGFKVGVSRPTYNRTLEFEPSREFTAVEKLGDYVRVALEKSDFLSIRKV